jgi:hypothetical protein
MIGQFPNPEPLYLVTVLPNPTPCIVCGEGRTSCYLATPSGKRIGSLCLRCETFWHYIQYELLKNVSIWRLLLRCWRLNPLQICRLVRDLSRLRRWVAEHKKWERMKRGER